MASAGDKQLADEAQELIARLGIDAPAQEAPDFPAARPLGVLVAFLCPAFMALTIALLYQAMALIMETEGGFVASGGPYVVAHPAPGWVWVAPVSVLALLGFGALNVATASRGWGISLVAFAWSGLFLALGWNFLRLGFSPPEGLEGAWAWITCGVIFWAMALWPLLPLVARGVLRKRYEKLLARQPSQQTRTVWAPPRATGVPRVYLVAQLVGAIAGVWAGIALFASLVG